MNPRSVTIGRGVSAAVFVIYPFLLLPGVMAIGASTKSLFATCTTSWFGAFLCTTTFYPLVFVLAVLGTRVALRSQRPTLASVLAWSPLLMLVATAVPSGVVRQIAGELM